jgi:hypothetical protein
MPSAKNWKKIVWKLSDLAVFGPLKQIFLELKIFLQICTLVEHVVRNTLSFGSVV